MKTDQTKRRGELFRELHGGPDILVLPNPWDAGTARMLANMGFAALATTSAGLAFALGRRDGDGAVSREETLRNVRDIIEATPLPVSADLENGFGESPDAVAETIRLAGEVGLSGGSIEDASYRPDDPILDRTLAVERIHSAVEAARGLPYPFTLTARSENFVRGRPDLDDTLWRLKAFEEAGADVLYAPALPGEDALRRVCGATGKPVNFVVGVGSAPLTLAELAAIGVRRVTLGSSFARVAFAAVRRAAQEVLSGGTFAYVDGVPTVSDFNEIIDPRERGGEPS